MTYPPRPSTAGFTLTELVMVVLIIGILSAVSLPRMADNVSYHRTLSGARRIKADLELARRRAISTSAGRTVSFSIAQNSYALVGLSHPDHPGQPYAVDLTEYPLHVTLQTAYFSDADDTDVEFNGHGVPDSGGTILITTGSYQGTIVLDGQTGEITVECGKQLTAYTSDAALTQQGIDLHAAIVAFRSAKGRFFARRKAALRAQSSGAFKTLGS